MKLTFKNFFTHLIFHPEEADKKDYRKSLCTSIALGVITLGTLHLLVGIGWMATRNYVWINDWLSKKTDNIQKVSGSILKPSISDHLKPKPQAESSSSNWWKQDLTEPETLVSGRPAELMQPTAPTQTGIAHTKPPLAKPKAPLAHSGTPVDEALQERRTPPLGRADTIIMDPITGDFKSEHGSGEFFKDAEIIEKLLVRRVYTRIPRLFITFTSNNKAIIQQQAVRGCTAAATAMLIKDNGKEPNWSEVQRRNLANKEIQLADIRAAALKPIVVQLKGDLLPALRDAITKKGSAIVSVNGEIGAHVIVVDEVSEKGVRLRDPYHGWEITVTHEAFLKRWSDKEIIQVEKR
jgi:hypothetical protein